MDMISECTFTSISYYSFNLYFHSFLSLLFYYTLIIHSTNNINHIKYSSKHSTIISSTFFQFYTPLHSLTISSFYSNNQSIFHSFINILYYPFSFISYYFIFITILISITSSSSYILISSLSSYNHLYSSFSIQFHIIVYNISILINLLFINYPFFYYSYSYQLF